MGLHTLRDRLAGATYAKDDESGDAHKFTQELAKHCVAEGVRFDFDVSIESLSCENEKITGVRTKNHGNISGDAYVLSLGSYSPLLARPLGIALPIYPLKGYSVTMPVRNPAAAWTTSLSDDAHKLVLSRLGERIPLAHEIEIARAYERVERLRLGDRLRVAGTAEMNGYNTEINEVRCRAIVDRVMALFPEAGDPSRAQFWAGLRPATPSNLPCIGRTRYPGLFLDTGHGTLGWTLACGSGKALADIVDARRPEVDFPFNP